MWSVIRRSQGLPENVDPLATAPPEVRFERHQRCLLLHEVKPNVPSMSPKVFTRPYGDLVFDKVRRWVLDEDPNVRAQGLDQLIELYVEQQENCARSLSTGAVTYLLSIMCTDEIADIREKAATALELLLRVPSAHRQVAAMEAAGEDPLQNILTALDDVDEGVVVIALRVIVACHARFSAFALTEKLVARGSIAKMIGLVEKGIVVVKAVACAALLPIFDVKEAEIQFMKLHGVQAVSEALASSSDDLLVAEVAELLSRVAETPEGKRECVRHGALQSLLAQLTNPNLTVRVAVVAAMAQITVLDAAKYQAVEIGVAARVCELAAYEDERDVLAHLARLVYHVAEHPQGRAQLRSLKPRFASLVELAHDDEDVARAMSAVVEILSRKTP